VIRIAAKKVEIQEGFACRESIHACDELTTRASMSRPPFDADVSQLIIIETINVTP
jgi:hypothetical protein